MGGSVRAIALQDKRLARDVAPAEEQTEPFGEAILCLHVQRQARIHVRESARLRDARDGTLTLPAAIVPVEPNAVFRAIEAHSPILTAADERAEIRQPVALQMKLRDVVTHVHAPRPLRKKFERLPIVELYARDACLTGVLQRANEISTVQIRVVDAI